MNSAIAERIWRAGARRRNPSLLEEYTRLKDSEWSTRERLDAIQMERLQFLLEFAHRHSPYHRAVFEAHGLAGGRVRDLSDFARLPIVDESALIANNAAMHAQAAFPSTFVAETSGTTGVALEFRCHERWDSINRAHVMRAYDCYGVKPWERNGYLWGYNIAPTRAWRVKLLDAAQNRFRLFRYDADSGRRFASRLQDARYLSGYSPMIYETAKACNAMGITIPGLAMVKGTSEMILDVYQSEAKQAFGRGIVSEYGAAEAGLIAFECPSGNMHVNVEDVVLEIADDDSVIVTNLASLSFPIIRYRLGDAAAWGTNECPCGRRHPIVREVMGQRGATVRGKSGNHPALTFYYVFKNLAILRGILLNYRAEQTTVGHCRLYVEGRDNSAREKQVREELVKYFGVDIDFAVEFVESLPRRQGKAQYFESTL